MAATAVGSVPSLAASLFCVQQVAVVCRGGGWTRCQQHSAAQHGDLCLTLCVLQACSNVLCWGLGIGRDLMQLGSALVVVVVGGSTQCRMVVVVGPRLGWCLAQTGTKCRVGLW